MAIKQGEITAIIGSNGAGKTSALMAISGLASCHRWRHPLRRTNHHRGPHDITRLGITPSSRSSPTVR